MDLTELNEAQRAAVTAPDGVQLVVAGAGTGKTRTLVHRVAWLLERGVPPHAITLLTFTRRASREMLERAAHLVGAGAHGVQGGTFHSFGMQKLRRHATLLGYTPNFVVLDRSDAEGLVGLIRAELGLGGGDKRFPKKGTVLDVLSRAVNTGRTLPDVLARDYPQYVDRADDIAAIGKRYAERKRAGNVMDFDDLLVLFARLLAEHPEAAAQIAGACEHVLVDEYQDTNRLQAQIALMLASAHGNLMAVGDEAQSIYAFRGAAVENILQLPEILPETQVMLLEENYRSTPQVLHLANGVLASASVGYGKVLRSPLADGAMPELVPVVDEHAQAETVARLVLKLREEGYDLNHTAVLFRSATHAHLLESTLTAADIPYRKFGGLRFNESSHVKDVLALLRLVANPRDEISWFRVLGWAEGLGARTAQSMARQLADAPEPRLDPAAFAKKKYHADLIDLAALLASASALDPTDVLALVDRVVSWVRDRLPRMYDDAKKRSKDLESLLLIAERHATLDDLLANLALDPVEQDADAGRAVREDEVLTLSTVHSAKGLEWDAVIVLQLADGAFPSGYALEDLDALEEERRLLYVAVTRAKRRLFLFQPQLVGGWQGVAHGPGCALLDAVPDLEDRVVRVRGGRGGAGLAAPATPSAQQADRMARILGFYGR
jgi:DNA helicase-2/ATP-dependent DNA helicase PcrA